MLRSGIRVARRDGLSTLVKDGVYLLQETFYRSPLYDGLDEGREIWRDDWDVLIVADACRYDLASRVLDGYDVSRSVSVGSHSKEWMENTFEGEREDTAYVCGNPFSKIVLDGTEVGCLDEVWRCAWNSELGTVPPRAMTDRAIRTWKEEKYEKMIVHYMQPHIPFLTTPGLGGGQDASKWGTLNPNDTWRLLRLGRVGHLDVVLSYMENLELVFEEIELLLSSIDAGTAVITSDHGNSIGENGIYGHPPGVNTPELRFVPWIETTASDTSQYQPGEEWKESRDETLEEKLSSLGYK